MSAVGEGLVALVTGATGGLGAAVAQRLGAEGVAVVCVGRTADGHPERPGSLRDTVYAIQANGGRAVPVVADLADPAARAGAVLEAEAAFGPIDILVNEAAAMFAMPFDRFSERRFALAFELNVRAPFDLAQRVLPGMRARRRGWILNVSSQVARLPAGPPFDPVDVHGGTLLYGMTKAALDRLSVGLAAEVFDDGIAVNALAPAVACGGGAGPAGWREPAEPPEVFAEAALVLCTGDPRIFTGRVTSSRAVLAEVARTPRTLDGRRPFLEPLA